MDLATIEQMLDDALLPQDIDPPMEGRDIPMLIKAGTPAPGVIVELWTSTGWTPALVRVYRPFLAGPPRAFYMVADAFEVEGSTRVYLLRDRDHLGPGGWRRDLRNLADLRRQFMIGGERG